LCLGASQDAHARRRLCAPDQAGSLHRAGISSERSQPTKGGLSIQEGVAVSACAYEGKGIDHLAMNVWRASPAWFANASTDSLNM